MKVLEIGKMLTRQTANGAKQVIELTLETPRGVLKLTPFANDHLLRLKVGDVLKDYTLEQNGKYYNLKYSPNKQNVLPINSGVTKNTQSLETSIRELHTKIDNLTYLVKQIGGF